MKCAAMADIMIEDTMMTGSLIEDPQSGDVILKNTLPEDTITENAILEDTMDIPLTIDAIPVGYSDSLLVASSNQQACPGLCHNQVGGPVGKLGTRPTLKPEASKTAIRSGCSTTGVSD